MPDLAGIDIEVSPHGQSRSLLQGYTVLETPTKAQQATLSEDSRQILQHTAKQTQGEVQQALLRLLKQ